VFDSAGQDPPPAAIAACNYERTRRLHITLFRTTSSWVVSSVLIPSLLLSIAKHESFKILVSTMTTNTGLSRSGGHEDQCLHPDWQKSKTMNCVLYSQIRRHSWIRASYYNSYSKNPNKMQQCIKILLFLILNEAQHVSGDTPSIIRSLKLHKQPLVLYTWKVVGRAVVGRSQVAYTVAFCWVFHCTARFVF